MRGFRRAVGWGTVELMSELEGEPTPGLEVDEADLLEQSTPVPDDDDEEYPFGAEDDGSDRDEAAIDYDTEDDAAGEEEA